MKDFSSREIVSLVRERCYKDIRTAIKDSGVVAPGSIQRGADIAKDVRELKRQTVKDASVYMYSLHSKYTDSNSTL